MPFIYKTGRTELRKQIEKHAGFIQGKVLDIGAGSFSRYQDLFNYREYIRMDIEPRKGVDIVGKIENIPFPDSSFDSIVCTQVLGDIYQLSTAFAELYRVLKPGGIILITESLFDPLHDEPNDFWRFTGYSLSRLAQEAGFEIKINEKRGGYWSVMSQLTARYWIERLNANQKWFSRLLSFGLRLTGSLAIFIDKHDKSRANKIFTHGYILIAQKNA